MPIVEAVFICTTSLEPARLPFAARMQAAQEKAVLDALAEGIDINDSATISARMKAAREATE